MGEESNIIRGKPAGYPKTTAAELDSKNIFQSLLDTRFIIGDLRVLDKYPNSDGILEITSDGQTPAGKIDIQLKTLPPKNYNSPRFSCNMDFFSYCEHSALPVILVTVNRKDRKVYWRHIDRDTLLEVSKNISGKSYTLSLPLENCIDGVHTEYISAWTKIAKEVISKVWNFDSVQEQKSLLETQLKDLESKLQNPVHFPMAIVRDIHAFLDYYNYILDVEFNIVKQVLYPDYWKIGIGITKYDYDHIQFLLYPVEFKKSQTLVKEVKKGDYDNIFKEMSNGNILMLANLDSENKIKETPRQYGYKLLEDSILRVAGIYNFPIENVFVAHEYIISFIDQYQAYLDMEKDFDEYSLKELKFKIYSVLPMLAATSMSFADWVVDYNDDIDSYAKRKTSDYHKKNIAEAIKKINEGFTPKVKVTTVSTRYNINLITYYINLLEGKGINEARRIYKTEQFNETMYGVDFWKTWNKEPLWSNVNLFFQNFYKLYNSYIQTHFPHIKNSLQIIDNDETTIIHIFHFDETKIGTPYMEVYYLRPVAPEKGQILCFLREDTNNPIDRIKFGIERDYNCSLNGRNYIITLMHVQTLDFMFKISPTYALINDKLREKLKEFFAKRKNGDL